jgi:queuosine precursor transporter
MTKKQKLFVVLSSLFIANALVAEFIGVKIFSLEKTLGIDVLNFSMFGNEMSLSYTAGVIIWPMVFIITDIVNEYYGEEGVKFISYLGAGIIAYAFVMIYLAIHTAPADWWVSVNVEKGVPNMNNAYAAIFGQGLNIIYGSLVAFVLGQLIDVMVFQKLKKMTKGKYLWLRATGSTVVSQAIDSFVVIFLAFYIGAGWKWNLVMAVALNNYIYKFLIALCITPILYVVHHFIDKYLSESDLESTN